MKGRSVALRVGLLILSVIVLAAIIIPAVAPAKVYELGEPLQGPSVTHPFGTDSLGRDVFVRCMAAARIDLGIALAGVAVSMVIGTAIGIAAGISRRSWLDALLMRIVDAFIAFPFLVLVLVIVVALGPGRSLGPLPAGLPATFIALVATDWAWYARLGRGQALSVRDRDYVVAARLAGFSMPRILLREVAPFVIRGNTAYAISDAVLFIIATASLAFLGAGVQAPAPEWGAMMFEGQTYLGHAWWITIFPGAMLALSGIGLSLVADALLAEARR
jgi:peptide/nickel transport system permease protein